MASHSLSQLGGHYIGEYTRVGNTIGLRPTGESFTGGYPIGISHTWHEVIPKWVTRACSGCDPASSPNPVVIARKSLTTREMEV